MKIDKKADSFLNFCIENKLTRIDLILLRYLIKETVDYKKGLCVNQYIIANEADLKINSVRQSIRRLRTSKIIKVKKTKIEGCHQFVNTYFIAPKLINRIK